MTISLDRWIGDARDVAARASRYQRRHRILSAVPAMSLAREFVGSEIADRPARGNGQERLRPADDALAKAGGQPAIGGTDPAHLEIDDPAAWADHLAALDGKHALAWWSHPVRSEGIHGVLLAPIVAVDVVPEHGPLVTIGRAARHRLWERSVARRQAAVRRACERSIVASVTPAPGIDSETTRPIERRRPRIAAFVDNIDA